MAKQDDKDRIARLWEHAGHEDATFDRRLQTFVTAEAVLVASASFLFDKPGPSRVLLLAVATIALVVTLLWFLVQIKQRVVLNDIRTQLKKVLAEYEETTERRASFSFTSSYSATGLLAIGLPLCFLLFWSGMLIGGVVLLV